MGVPISLSLEKQTTHQTILGGCCSIFAIGFLLFIFYSEIQQVFFQLNWDETNQISYMRQDDGHEAYVVSTDDVIPALQLYSLFYNEE